MLGPGRIATDRTKQLDEANAKKNDLPVEQVTKTSTAAIPVGRYGDPEEFGSTAAFLVSERASYITGSMIRCDGGAIKSV
jgi:3-oxoacyl-[acyl-carrier protein] reductase